MWARAKVAEELIKDLSGQEPTILDTQKRIAEIELKNAKTTSNS